MPGDCCSNVAAQSLAPLRTSAPGSPFPVTLPHPTPSSLLRQTILETVSILAMVINAALIAFTGLFAVDQTWSARIWIFISTASGLYMSPPSPALPPPDPPPE
jgi:hypothetical protein